MKSFEGSGILVTQAKVSLQTTGLATQLLKIKHQCECRVKLVETMKRAEYTIKEAVQAIQLYFEGTCSISRYIQKKNAKQ